MISTRARSRGLKCIDLNRAEELCIMESCWPIPVGCSSLEIKYIDLTTSTMNMPSSNRRNNVPQMILSPWHALYSSLHCSSRLLRLKHSPSRFARRFLTPASQLESLYPSSQAIFHKAAQILRFSSVSEPSICLFLRLEERSPRNQRAQLPEIWRHSRRPRRKQRIKAAHRRPGIPSAGSYRRTR